MALRPLACLPVTTAAGLLLTGLLAGTPAGAEPPAPSERSAATSVPARAGSDPKGVGYVKLRLTALSNGKIKVSWTWPGSVRNLKRFVVRVGPSRALDTRVRSYRVNRKRHSLVVPRAAGVTPASGNYTFVRVLTHRKRATTGSSPTAWIQAPITASCTAAAQDRLTVGTFNVRTWMADTSNDPLQKWSVRGPNVVAEILQSGAHAIAVQEASGPPSRTYGGKGQAEWILDELNRADPDPAARWVDALTRADYKPPRGRKAGLVGTRVFYDADKYTELASGLRRLVDPKWFKDSVVPWARLRSTSGTQAPFVLTSNHLRVGPGAAEYATRVRQTTQLVSLAKELRTRFGDTVVVAGDLNSTANQKPLNYVQHTLLGAGMYDAYATTDLSGGEFPTTNSSHYPVPRTPLRRDYILTYGPVAGSCSYVNRVYQRRPQEASDHFMQVATVPLPPA